MMPSTESDSFDAIKNAAADLRGWDKNRIEVGNVSKLDREGCRFYRASYPGRADASPVEYAMLQDGRLIGGEREKAKAMIGGLLQQCGQNASPEWWAQVVSRYAGTGGVPVTENTGAAIRQLKNAGIPDYMPTLIRQDGRTVVTYFTYNYDRGATSKVTAVLDAGGQLTVSAERIK